MALIAAPPKVIRIPTVIVAHDKLTRNSFVITRLIVIAKERAPTPVIREETCQYGVHSECDSAFHKEKPKDMLTTTTTNPAIRS